MRRQFEQYFSSSLLKALFNERYKPIQCNAMTACTGNWQLFSLVSVMHRRGVAPEFNLLFAHTLAASATSTECSTLAAAAHGKRIGHLQLSQLRNAFRAF